MSIKYVEAQLIMFSIKIDRHIKIGLVLARNKEEFAIEKSFEQKHCDESFFQQLFLNRNFYAFCNMTFKFCKFS